MQQTLRSRTYPRMRLFFGLALVAGLLCQPAPLVSMLELLSSGVALLAALSNEGQLETYIEVALEDCQMQIKRLQLAWQRLSYGCRMAAIAMFRVFGPVVALLTLVFVQALRRSLEGHTPSTDEEYPC